jgi:hypothetical protein
MSRDSVARHGGGSSTNPEDVGSSAVRCWVHAPLTDRENSMNSSIISNGVEVKQLTPPTCDTCGAEPAVIVVRVQGTPVVREVCQRCLIDNDGRIGWPCYADVVRGFVG